MNPFKHQDRTRVKVIKCQFTNEELGEINCYLKMHHLELEEAIKDALLKTIQDDFDEQMISNYKMWRQQP